MSGTAYGIVIKDVGVPKGAIKYFFKTFFENNEDQREAIIAQAMAGIKVSKLAFFIIFGRLIIYKDRWPYLFEQVLRAVTLSDYEYVVIVRPNLFLVIPFMITFNHYVYFRNKTLWLKGYRFP